MVRRLLASPYPPRAVLGVPARLADLAADLAGAPFPVYATSADVLARTRRLPPQPRRARRGRPRARAGARPAAGRRPPGAGARGRQRPREPRRAVPQRRRARGRRGAARPALRRPALPPVGAGLDGPRAAGPVRPAADLAGELRRVRAAGFTVLALDPAPAAVAAVRPSTRGAEAGAAARRRGPRPDRRGARGRATSGSASRWRPASTRSTSPPPPPSRCTTCADRTAPARQRVAPGPVQPGEPPARRGDQLGPGSRPRRPGRPPAPAPGRRSPPWTAGAR